MSDAAERRRQREARRRQLAAVYDIPAEAEAASVVAEEEERQQGEAEGEGMMMVVGGAVGRGAAGGNSIDRAGFEPKAFLRDTLERSTVSALVRETNKFEAEISDLDSEMQNLVYDNYSKFISATDTIRQMKRNVEDMENEMQHLIKSMELINRKSDKVTHNLGSRRSAVEVLSRREKILMQLKDLYELPRFLKNCVIKRAYKMAVERFVDAELVLEELKDKKSFAKIYEDCRKQVALIAEHLKTRLLEASGESEAQECVELLLSLGEPSGYLCSSYLHSRKHVVFDQEWKVKSDHSFQAPIPLKKSKNNPESLEDLREKMICPLINLCETCDRLFWRNGDLEMTEDIFEILRDMYHVVFAAVVSIAQKKEVPSVFSSQFQLFVGFLLDVTKLRAELKYALRARTLSDMVKADFTGVIEEWMTTCLDLSKAALERHQNIRLQSIVASKGSSREDCESLCVELGRDVKTFLAGFQSFSHSPNHFVADLSKRHTRSVFLTLSSLIKPSRYTQEREGTACIELNDSTDCFRHLVFCKLSHIIAQQTLPTVAAFLRETIDFQPGSKEARLFNVEKIQQDLFKLAEGYLMDFVRLAGSSITSLVKKAVETPNWLNMKTPREVRQPFIMIQQELVSFRFSINELFPALGNAGGVGGIRNRPRIVLDFNAIEMDVDRMMSAEKSTFSIQLPRLEATSILTELIKFQLKSLLELVRTRTFDRCGAQQMQVNCSYLSKVWAELIDPEQLGAVSEFLARVLRSVTERCLDPGFLDEGIVDDIVARALN